MVLDTQALSNRRIGLTGGSGRLGGRLLESLLAAGAQVVALTRRAPAGPPHPRLAWVKGELGNDEALRRAFEGCDTAFHLAGLAQMAPNPHATMDHFETNALATARVGEACWRAGVHRLIYTSTCHVYGPPHVLPVSENHPTQPLSLYAASKLAGEAAVQGYAAAGKFAGWIARLANVYGAGFGPDTVIGRAFHQVCSGQPIRLRSLQPVRDFVHVDDVVHALILLAQVPPQAAACMEVNVATGVGTSIGEAAQTLVAVACESGLERVEVVEEIPGYQDPIPAFVMDSSKLMRLTGWAPELTLRQGLKRSLHELIEERT